LFIHYVQQVLTQNFIPWSSLPRGFLRAWRSLSCFVLHIGKLKCEMTWKIKVVRVHLTLKLLFVRLSLRLFYIFLVFFCF
jgi:hypothetical protein